MSHVPPTRLISDMRGVRYGEVLAVFACDGGLEAEVYGTQMLNDRPQELWDTLDPAVIAPEGWSCRTRVLEEVDTTATVATVIQDELENTYTLPG